MIGLGEAFARLEGLCDELDAHELRARFETAEGKVELEVGVNGRAVSINGVRVEITS